ncbi:MAG: hypothetical protein AAGI30_12300 [Planctomycetota bacterium]
MYDQLSPGQSVRCTITKRPNRQDVAQTIARLMRQDPAIRKRLRKAQQHRERTMKFKTRGGRPWAQRVSPAKHAVPNQGATWTMPYIPHLVPEFRAVADHLQVEQA